MTYYEHLVKAGGMVTCGEHLGVFIAPEKHIQNCPPGWVFIPLETATSTMVKEAIAIAKQGRKNWPSNAHIR